MIGVIFQFGTEVVEVRVMNENVYFRTSNSPNFGSIDEMKLDKHGVVKEFPELKDDIEWQRKARAKFKEKIRVLPNEEQRIKYIIEDLSKFGYIPLYIQKQGFRPRKL